MSGYDKRVITLDKTVREWEQRYGELSGKVVALENVSAFQYFVLPIQNRVHTPNSNLHTPKIPIFTGTSHSYH